MPYTCSEAASPGGCSPMTCLPGRASTTTFGCGGWMAPGRISTTSFLARSANTQVEKPHLALDYGQPVGEDYGKRGPRGYDGGKKVNGRTPPSGRHSGPVTKAKVHPGEVQ